jgi:hypothetical protein
VEVCGRGSVTFSSSKANFFLKGELFGLACYDCLLAEFFDALTVVEGLLKDVVLFDIIPEGSILLLLTISSSPICAILSLTLFCALFAKLMAEVAFLNS